MSQEILYHHTCILSVFLLTGLCFWQGFKLAFGFYGGFFLVSILTSEKPRINSFSHVRNAKLEFHIVKNMDNPPPPLLSKLIQSTLSCLLLAHVIVISRLCYSLLSSLNVYFELCYRDVRSPFSILHHFIFCALLMLIR